MTALGKLFRTTAFKLSLVYLTVFALFAAVLIGYFAWTTSSLITQQITETISAEISGLSEAYGQGGIRRLVLIVDARSRRPGSNLYLVTTPAGEGLAGNIDSLQPGVLEQPGLTETTYRRLDDTEEGEQRALDSRRASDRRLPAAGRTRSRRARAAARHHAGDRALVDRRRRGARARGRVLRHAPRAQADRCDERHRAHHHGGRPRRTPADRRHRRRARPPGGKPQRDARTDRGADARPQGGVGQHRP